MKTSTANRVKKSYSLSVESEQYVRRYRKVRKIASDSEALDRLLQEVAAREKMSGLETAYRSHYDLASDQESTEEATWTELGSTALATVEWNA